jgi:hypothetical protein
MGSATNNNMNIIYRLVENEVITPVRAGHRPAWYSKFNCLNSFLRSVDEAGNLVTSVTFVHDGPPGPLLERIPSKYNIDKISVHDNAGSLIRTFDVAQEIGGDTYFIEDDYLHLPDAITKMAQALPQLGIITGYDHPDRYTRTDDIIYHKQVIFDPISNHHWRTTESSCCTYAVLEDTRKTIDPIARKHLLQDRLFFRELHRMNIKLWNPIPALATQVDPFMSPGIDWEQVNSKFD